MIPSASSYGPPPGSHMYQSGNMLSHQMQGMKLGSPEPENSAVPMNKTHPSNQQMVPGSQQINTQQKAQISTTVTYSGQSRAMYPYMNNNPENMDSRFQKTSVHNNNQYISNSPFPAQLNAQWSAQQQKAGMQHSMSPAQTYSQDSVGINQTNGITNGHENIRLESKHPSSQIYPPHSLQYQSHRSAEPSVMSQHGPTQFQQQEAMNSPLNATVPVQRYPAPPASQMIQSPGQVCSPMSKQPMPPPPPSEFQASPPQVPPTHMPPINHMTSACSPVGSLPSSSSAYLGSGSPAYSGMSPNMPSSPNMWPASQFNSATPQVPSAYPYTSPNQDISQQQPRKLDLDNMPSTVQVRDEDRKTRNDFYQTDTKGQPPPLVTTNFIVQDRGMCSPRFIRSSVYCLPNQPDILKQTAIPFALTISPFASLNEGETQPPLALYREQGPLRCKRCKAYICPFMTFLEGGRCFQCAFCKVVTEVPQDYFCFLDGMGERTDKYHRPELCLGSYEYLATKEYCRNDELPNPPAYIFMIEVSNATFRNGLVPLLCENMKNVLQCLQNDEYNDTSKLRVGFVTYNSVLHFYNMKKNLTQPHIMVLSDVHNAFVPLLDGFLVTLSEAEALVDCLMEHIPRLFINEPATEIILGPVVQVGLEALKNANCAGKLLIFHSTIPNADAPGKLPHRDGQKLLGTDKQKIALSPQTDFYNKLAQECVAAGCAVDIFLFPSAYVDIASISPLCRHTGGQMYKYTYFQSHIDGDTFLEDLERNITTTTAFDAVLRVRTSAGISPVFYYGNFYMSNATDIELSAIDCHKAVTVELAYDDKLSENETVYIQAALLYTSCTGERRIRVHNLAVVTSVGMPDVYKCCELDTIINFFSKQALKQILEHSPQTVRNNLINRSVKILSCYRKNCASSSSTGQLILPDSLKLLPLYINCLLKSDAISGGSEMGLDDRNFAMLAVNSMDVKSTAIYFYPNLIPLHEIDPDSDVMPSPVRCAVEKLNDNGAYLLENGLYMLLWIGQAINPDWLQNVFGVQSTNLVDKQKTSLPELNTPLSKKIRTIIEDLEEGGQWYMRLRVTVQGDKLDAVFRQFLVEDRGRDGSPSYVEFLCHLHREISKNL